MSSGSGASGDDDGGCYADGYADADMMLVVMLVVMNGSGLIFKLTEMRML